MRWGRNYGRQRVIVALLVLSLGESGCHSSKLGGHYWAPPRSNLEAKVPPPPPDVPRELSKVAMPDYVIEPPDILLIDAIKVVPKSPYRIESLDQLAIQAPGALLEHPLDGQFVVEPGGTIDLGPPYGSVQVAGLDLPGATRAIEKKLHDFLSDPTTHISLAQSAGTQQISGEHMVGPDGKVTLGSYGKVFVTGLTQQQAKQAIETHLAQFLENPRVAVDIYAYNSKFYYVITDGAGLGDAVVKFPITGNETVLDALAEVNGMQEVSSKRIWIARPTPYGTGCDEILAVDWHGISQRAETATNYQLLPGDRLFIAHDPLVATNNAISKFVNPFQRFFGGMLMGTYSIRAIKFFSSNTGGFGGGV
ncbi:MAG TPA: polysaccharide biosynthesis/export family protein [Pirellulales bacterium]|nr:polysaccharide biosynthesis/export family protein [Pirellulales bacterium]